MLSVAGLSYDEPLEAFGEGGAELRGGDPNRAADESHAIGQAESVPGEILVGFEGAVVDVFSSQGAEKALEKAGKLVGPLGLNKGKALFDLPPTANAAARLATQWKLPASADVLQTIAQLNGLEGIAYAEPNMIMTIDYDMLDPSLHDDAWSFGVQEHLIGDPSDLEVRNINVEPVWNSTTNPTGGAGVTVAVLDTGVDLDHPDLDSSILTGGKGKAPKDDHGHGTHVAGIIAAEIDNTGDLASEAENDSSWYGGTVGVAPEATIMPIKVLDANGRGSAADIAKGIDTASNNGADIINMSLGGGFSQTISDAILAAYSNGVLVISSAGNSNRESSGHPASDPYSLSVAAVDSGDVKAGFSNYGYSVDIAAPGVDILSTFIDLDDKRESGYFTGAYGRIGGTSMSSPVVAGVAALIKSQHLDWGPDEVAAQLLATTALANGDLIDSLNRGYEGKLGAGRVDALAALGAQITAPVVIAVGGIGADGGTVYGTDPVISVQFSHVMNDATDGAGVLNPLNYELYYLGADEAVGGEDADADVEVGLSMLPTPYDAFPGRGVELQVDGAVNDGTYMFKVLAGIQAANDNDLNDGDYTRKFTVVPTQITDFAPVEPLGSLVYQARVAATFNGSGDVDTFTIDLDGDPEQVVSIQVNRAEEDTHLFAAEYVNWGISRLAMPALVLSLRNASSELMLVLCQLLILG